MRSKTIVITGVSSGVGYAAAKLFQAAGHQVIGLSRSDHHLPEGLVHFSVDLTDYNKTYKVCQEILNRCGKVDVLVNCAAIFETVEFVQQDPHMMETIVRTNIMSYLNITRELLPSMLEAAEGLIVNISSVSGKNGIINQAVYSASKYALDGFASALSKEVHQTGVKITTLYPGGINTELWNTSNPYHGQVEKTLDPADVANLIKFVTELPQNIVMKEMVFFPTNEIH